MGYIQRKLKENDHHLHEVWADSIGHIVHHVLKNVQDFDDWLENFNNILKQIFANLTNPSQNIQEGGGMWLRRLIQNAPIDCLRASLENLSEKLMNLLASNHWKCYTQILESLISLILAVEEDFEPYAVNFLPYLLECMAMEDWATRKMAIDIIYTFAAILKDVLIPFKSEILEVLNHSRFDKFKPVREATLEAYQAIKNLGEDNTSDMDMSKDSKKPRPSIRDAIRQDKKKVK